MKAALAHSHHSSPSAEQMTRRGAQHRSTIRCVYYINARNNELFVLFYLCEKKQKEFRKPPKRRRARIHHQTEQRNNIIIIIMRLLYLLFLFIITCSSKLEKKRKYFLNIIIYLFILKICYIKYTKYLLEAAVGGQHSTSII